MGIGVHFRFLHLEFVTTDVLGFCMSLTLVDLRTVHFHAALILKTGQGVNVVWKGSAKKREIGKVSI